MISRTFRLGLLALCFAPLGACSNYVMSETPLFTAADEVGRVPLRRGVWKADTPDCAFDETKPLKAWPECADGFVVGRRGLKVRKLGAGVDRIAAGDPMIVQYASDGKPRYSYFALAVRERDAEGRAIALSAWPVACSEDGIIGGRAAGPADAAADEPADGSAPSPPTPPEAPAPPPRKLFPGLAADGDNCLAGDSAAVRRAARGSEPHDASAPGLRWLREGRR